MSERTPPHFVILGGGSAGWITACLLQHLWGARGTGITVVESPEIGIIGVGEGSTPQLKAMFDMLGIAEKEWMPVCDATYKLGIRFTGWSERPGFESYFHPFPGPVDHHTEPGFVQNCMLARRGFDVPALPDDFFLAASLASEGRGPHPNENFPFAPSYGYHFDAFKLGAFLRDWAIARGVSHKPLSVEDIEVSETGEVRALLCQDGVRVEGDFFVDCSGFRALIAQQKLGGDFLPFADNLFADSAVVMPARKPEKFLPQTHALAMDAGWRWHIPLTSRVGNGYVYSSRYISDEQAEKELRCAIGLQDGEEPARFLKMKVGRMQDSWSGNCLATGLAQGFIEPLEATALHIVIATALEFAKAFEQGGFTPQYREQFNRQIGERYEAIRDYIVAHYRLNQRTDTEFWLANASNNNLSENLKAMITAWFTHKNIASLNSNIYSAPAYSSMSWHCLFAGYGTFPTPEKIRSLPTDLSAFDREETRKFLSTCTSNFPALD